MSIWARGPRRTAKPPSTGPGHLPHRAVRRPKGAVHQIWSEAAHRLSFL